MTRFLWISHPDGGGNLPPSLGVARALRDRGHDVTFLGRPEMVDRVKAEGFRPRVLASAYADLGRFPHGHPMSRIACVLTSPGVEQEIEQVIAAEAPDVLLVDAMFPTALSAAAASAQAAVMFCHTFFYRLQTVWEGVFARIAALNDGAGFAHWSSRESLWKAQDHILVTSSGELDDAPIPGWNHVRHVGPVLDNETAACPVELPWEASDQTPLVLLSLSTTSLASAERLQTALDALAPLPVHVVATTSPQIDPSRLRAPDNAHVV